MYVKTKWQISNEIIPQQHYIELCDIMKYFAVKTVDTKLLSAELNRAHTRIT